MRPFYVRELTRYPVGIRRLRYLLMAVLASLILNFEGQIAPVLPLLLDDLHMTLTTYGAIGAVAVAVGAVSAAIGGRLADRWGRTILLVPIMFVTAILDYATVLVHTPGQLLLVRSVLLFVEGAAVTTTAGLVRDFSPRMGRSTAFAFWTWGPVGANFLAAGIAAVTLPLFVSWRSQFIIIGTVALIVSVIITVYIADLAPQLRAQVIHSEADMAGIDASGAEEVQLGQARQLLRHRRVMAHLVGITSWQVFYWTLQVFGPTISVQAFGYHREPGRHRGRRQLGDQPGGAVRRRPALRPAAAAQAVHPRRHPGRAGRDGLHHPAGRLRPGVDGHADHGVRGAGRPRSRSRSPRGWPSSRRTSKTSGPNCRAPRGDCSVCRSG